MSMKMTKWAYMELIAGDLEWLKQQPDSLEREHIVVTLTDSVERIYNNPLEDQITTLQKDKAELVEALDNAINLCSIAEHAWEQEDDALLLNCQAIAAKNR